MAMLSSCTTIVSLAPPPGKSSRAAALQLRSRQPGGGSGGAARWASRKESKSRAALLACHAQNDKYNIEPSALVHPRAFRGRDWSLVEDEIMNRITLSLNVGESTTHKDLEVATTQDQTLLVIRYNNNKQEEDKSSPARSLDVRLLMPPGYDSDKMQAILWNTGWLEISIPKPKHEPNKITITPLTAKPQQQTNQ